MERVKSQVFVRWKQRSLKRQYGDRGLYAVLVQNRREHGRVKQQVVKHLAGIHESQLQSPYPLMLFWETVGRRLDALHLDDTERKRIEARLLEVVRKPTQEELRAIEELLKPSAL